MSIPTVQIEEYCDGFAIIVDGERFHFDQEDTKERLIEVFEALDLDINVSYEEVC